MTDNFPASKKAEESPGPDAEGAHLLNMGLDWLRDIHRIHYTLTFKFTWCAILCKPGLTLHTQGEQIHIWFV